MTTSKIRTLVVDDEPAARRGVRLLLERDPDVVVVGEAASGAEAVKKITEDKPDLVFLDVQMPEMNGFKVLEAVAARHVPAVIFVTAYDQHALRAFEVNAVDYLLKPFEDQRFWASVSRAKAELQRRQADALGDKLTHLLSYLRTVTPMPPPAEFTATNEAVTRERILLKSGGEIYFLKADEIDWIEAEGDYMKFHAGGRAHLLRETMGRLEDKLDARRFIRIHRSTIVNIDRVKKLSPSFAGEYAVILADGTKLRLSRGYHERLQELMKTAL
ncbi:MAG TPA: LytTR family DNA-binding domain-containing protein [Candidatus Didemnitutus sp.]|nr:LytTR family DNA-binding domain-containing protein [Candidatus Didemnitutus sp.]